MNNQTMSPSSSDQMQKSFHFKSLKKFALKFYHKASSYFILIIITTIQLLRPLLGTENVCPFTIGCTEYAIIELQKSSFITACLRITKRLLMCNPITNILKK